MATKSKKKSSLGENRTSANVWFLIIATVLIILLLVMYIKNRNRTAEFERLQLEAAGSEIVNELEPRVIEEIETDPIN